MNSYRRTNFSARRSSPERGALWTITVFAVLLLLSDFASGGALRAYAQSPAASASGNVNNAWQAIKYSGMFRSNAVLADRVRTLEEQVAHYQTQDAAYKVLEDTNKHLAEAAHLTHDDNGITVPVVSSSRTTPYGTFLIGAGADDGVTKGALVLTTDGFALGRVSQVEARSALVTTLLAPGAQTDALVSSAEVMVSGTGGGTAKVQVPRGVSVMSGDIIMSHSAGGKAIGVVGKVDADPADAYSTVYLHLPHGADALHFVYVVLPRITVSEISAQP